MPEFLNDAEHTYLSMEADFSLRDHFELRMLEENKIPGILNLSICEDETILKLNYDITGLLSLSEFSSPQKLREADLRRLILSMKHVVGCMEPYLLQPSGLLLSPETVFLSPLSRSPCFLYLPGRLSHFGTDLTEFLKSLMSCTDHDDYPSAVLAYRLYKESIEHPSALDRLEQILVSQESGEEAALFSGNGPANLFSDEEELPKNTSSPEIVTEIREVSVDNTPALSDTEKGGLLRRLFQ